MPKTSNSIGNLIREMRKAAGMSQQRLAAKIGVSYQQIQKYEKGLSQLNVPWLMQFAEVFGVPVEAFLEDRAGTKRDARFSNIDKDEVIVLKLYRKLPGKRLRVAFLDILRDLLKLSDGAQRTGGG